MIKHCWVLSFLLIGCAADDGVGANQATATVCGQGSGRHLFELETFDGNGRTCASCHQAGTRTISPAQAQALFDANPDDPLFQHDAADGFGDRDIEVCTVTTAEAACSVKKPGVRCRVKVELGVTYECETSFTRFLAHATIRVGIDPAANVTANGSNATVFVNRGIPTTQNTAALDPVLMYDGRAPNLQEQARGALAGHADVHETCENTLDKIAEFQQGEFTSPALEEFARSGTVPALPEGTTESEKRGRTFFIPAAQPGKDGFCAICHAGPMLDTSSLAVALPEDEQLPGLTIEPGERFMTVGVSERNALANPVYLWALSDGLLVRTIESPDIGLAAITGKWDDVNQFKIPTLWGVRDRAPYFHDNSAKTLEEVVEHYAVFFAPLIRGTVLTEQDQADIVAFLRLL